VLIILVVVVVTSLFGTILIVVYYVPTTIRNIIDTSSNECQQMMKIRKQDTVPLDSTTQSIFNCYSPFGQCQYYRPAHFFHPKCSSSSSSCYNNNNNGALHQVQESFQSTLFKQQHETFNEMIQLRNENKLWIGQPPIIIPWISTRKEMYIQRRGRGKGKEPYSLSRHNLSFIHVHKAGGTSIISAMKDLNVYNKHTNNNTAQHFVILDNDGHEVIHSINQYKGIHTLYTQLRIKSRTLKAWTKIDAFFNQAVTYQPEHKWDESTKIGSKKKNVEYKSNDNGIDESSNRNNYDDDDSENYASNYLVKKMSTKKTMNHMIFALIRDPVERFVSAVGQVTSTKYSKKGSGKRLKETCVSSLQEEEDEKTEQQQEQVHFSSSTTSSTQSILRCFVNLIKKEGYWIDVHFTPMIFEISFATMQKDVPIAIFSFDQLPNILNELGVDPRIKRKDGSKAGYRLEAMTNATVYDLELDVLKDLCRLYIIDVVFMRDLGFDTHCDDFIFI
jgi:hypothetical protein